VTTPAVGVTDACPDALRIALLVVRGPSWAAGRALLSLGLTKGPPLVHATPLWRAVFNGWPVGVGVAMVGVVGIATQLISTGRHHTAVLAVT
jgi:hypothetical protein